MHEYQQEVISLTHEKEDLIAQINEASRVKKRGSENMEVENEWLRKQISGLVAENQNMQIQVDQLRNEKADVHQKEVAIEEKASIIHELEVKMGTLSQQHLALKERMDSKVALEYEMERCKSTIWTREQNLENAINENKKLSLGLLEANERIADQASLEQKVYLILDENQRLSETVALLEQEIERLNSRSRIEGDGNLVKIQEFVRRVEQFAKENERLEVLVKEKGLIAERAITELKEKTMENGFLSDRSSKRDNEKTLKQLMNNFKADVGHKLH